jgi:hypothetical protein
MLEAIPQSYSPSFKSESNYLADKRPVSPANSKRDKIRAGGNILCFQALFILRFPAYCKKISQCPVIKINDIS